MPASSSRIMIAPVEGSRPLSDRFVDRLLGWWDTGGGQRLRRAVRGGLATAGARLHTVLAPVLQRPLVAKPLALTASGLAATRRWLAKAFASEVPAAPSRREDLRATVATESGDAPTRPAAVSGSTTAEIRTPLRSPTAEIRTPVRSGTGEIRTPLRSPTGELRPRTASSITRPVLTPIPSAPAQTTAMTTNLRCWSCLQRNRVRTPRRGGCFLCTACNATMLVVDPIVGLTCDIAQAEGKGINLNRQADETDPG